MGWRIVRRGDLKVAGRRIQSRGRRPTGRANLVRRREHRRAHQTACRLRSPRLYSARWGQSGQTSARYRGQPGRVVVEERLLARVGLRGVLAEALGLLEERAGCAVHIVAQPGKGSQRAVSRRSSRSWGWIFGSSPARASRPGSACRAQGAVRSQASDRAAPRGEARRPRQLADQGDRGDGALRSESGSRERAIVERGPSVFRGSRAWGLAFWPVGHPALVHGLAKRPGQILDSCCSPSSGNDA